MTLNRTGLIDGFVQAGVEPGMLLFVHASMRSLGPVEGGAHTVVTALLEVLGPTGTLAVPIFHDYFLKGPGQVWDREHSVSKMGALSELVRTWPNARRSAHPSHPIAAIGPLAQILTDCDSGSPFGPNSAFCQLLEHDTTVLLIGVDYSVCTLFHVAEEASRVPYRYWVDLEGTVVVDGAPKRVIVPFYRRQIGYSNWFLPCGNNFEDQGGVVRTRLAGKSEVRCLQAHDLYEHTMTQLRENPMRLVRRANFLLWRRGVVRRIREELRVLQYRLRSASVR